MPEHRQKSSNKKVSQKVTLGGRAQSDKKTSLKSDYDKAKCHILLTIESHGFPPRKSLLSLRLFLGYNLQRVLKNFTIKKMTLKMAMLPLFSRGMFAVIQITRKIKITFQGREKPININNFAGLSRKWVGVKLFMCFPFSFVKKGNT